MMSQQASARGQQGKAKTMNIAVITGASSGIGEEFLRQIVRERGSFGSIPFEEIWVIARRADRLMSLRSELDPVRIRVFTVDLTSPSAIDDLSGELSKRKPTIGLLVNCAGVGCNGLFETVPRSEVHKIISLNCAVLAEFTSVCIPYMIPNGDLCTYKTGPRILNIASSAGFLPQPGAASYAASKAFVISFSRALHAELKVHNIASTTVCPGPVATEFAAVATGIPGAKAKGFKSLFVVKPQRLVKRAIIVSKYGRGLYVYGVSQKILHVLSKILPTRFLLFLVTKLSKDAHPLKKAVPDQPEVVLASTVREIPVSPAAGVPLSAAAGVPAAPSNPVLSAIAHETGNIFPTSDHASRILTLYKGKSI